MQSCRDSQVLKGKACSYADADRMLCSSTHHGLRNRKHMWSGSIDPPCVCGISSWQLVLITPDMLHPNARRRREELKIEGPHASDVRLDSRADYPAISQRARLPQNRATTGNLGLCTSSPILDRMLQARSCS